jgi:predicted esterase
LWTIAQVLAKVEANGIPPEKVVIGGFSQGACLASEFVARNARRYGGLLVFSGGLIGPPGSPREYAGSLDGTPVFLGCSDTDPHIPLERVHDSTTVLERLGARVTKRIYPGMGHTIIQDEIDQAQRILDNVRVG